jgi:ELWxxDGT repeat protein
MQKILSTQLIRTVIAILLFLSFARQGVSSPNYAHAVDAREEERLESEMSTSAIDGFSESANAAGPAYLVKDISKGSGYQLGGFTVVGDMLYFMAVKYLSPGCVEELWKSDGSGEGTVLVKRFTRIDDYCPGYPTNQMVGVANTLYFNFNDGIHGDELWKSDGTESGTVMVKDIAPGSVSSFPGNFTDIGGVLYFKAEDDYAFEAPRTGELWKSDGTESGTVQVKDVTPRYLTEFNGAVYFDGESGVADAELWKSDGTEAGTVLVKAINFGRPASLGDFTVINGVLYFGAYTSPWSHLWKSDGTEAGTVGVKSFVGFGHQLELTNFNEVLYLRASHDSSVGDELFMSDGTDIGTILVKDINPTGDASPQNLTVVGNLLYFSASDGTNGEELWKSDGTESGTVMVKDINSGSGDASIEQLTNVGGDLCFIADDGVKGRELWISNGSESGTNLVKDIVTGFEDSSLVLKTQI